MKTFDIVLIAFFLPAILSAQTIDPRKTGNVPITFYGKLVDQNNEPVVASRWMLARYN
jgi:hypothetical protein